MKNNSRAAGPKLARLPLYVSLALPLAALAQVAEQSQPVMPQVEVQAQKEGDTGYTTRVLGTATPLGLSIRETPQAVSVITRERIEDQGLATITDVVNNATGVSVNQYETHRAGFTARGFDITNLQIDGIPTTWEQSWSAGETLGSLAIYERVEIVRGATGLMTGAGNPSAAINLIRKRATSKELTGTAEVGIGRWNERRAMADVSTALNETGSVRARVVGEYRKADSWVDSLKNKDKTIFATVEADLAPGTLLSAGASRQETDPQGSMWGGLPFYYTDGTKTNWDRSKTTAADWTTWSSSYDNYFVNLEHNFANGWQARASYTRGDRKGDTYLLYLSGVPDRVTGLGMNDFSGSYNTRSKQDDFSLHASGPFALGGRQHEAAFGYLHSKQEFNSDSRAADYGNVSHAVGNFNNFNPGAYPQPAWSPRTFYERSETKQQGLYGVLRFSLADPLKLIVGARVSNYEKTGVGLWTAAYAIKKDREVTPYAGLVYDIDRNWSAYASYTDIFQPQNLKDFDGNLLDPIVGKSYETGIKGAFLDNRLNAQFSVFRIKQDKLGVAVDNIDRDGDGPLLPETYYRAADGAESKGFEAELSGELARGWNATAGYSYFKAEESTGAQFNSIYPRKTLRVFTTYRFPGELSKLTVGGGANWESRTWTADPSAPAGSSGLIEQDAFTLVNLMARYDINDRLSAQLNIDNAFDKKHYAMFAAFNAITYQAPRSVSATLRYQF
ncbi:TonB-dependent siderophore receptor [Massilia dura]|uniref:TonB-dependent siderophore receptor n=1 Tax=Pseudoduganella dura TaxID=321982 RepID=A0A6I3XW45_9BURK|nr:TonB-dependent siderophore receptor [Pseudoduganella dura]MUI15965.1 TonB-dependent siderophore receptor [Pseudoduganella dura]GGX94869.1 ferric-rhodotorulic acid/ferric-coprogen receptor FhuE [Pseudoduganella dura]